MADITFVDHAIPVLAAGDYTITATQSTPLDPQPYAAARTFTVSGDRFTLPPDRVTAMFPPDGSLGDHHNVLPHIVLDRPTLPWERSAGVPGPWLVLLLFAETERPRATVIRLGDLGTPLEPHQAPGDPVAVIDVPRRLLEAVMPSPADLPYLAHVRRTEGTPDAGVVIGNRLPPAAAPSTVHLVSVEGRFTAAGFDFGDGAADSTIRLVSLASWRFACLDENQAFATLVRDLAQDGSAYRLPDSGDAAADPCLRLGYVPMRHALRQGGGTISWYRGPFATGPRAPATPTAALTADHLLCFHPDTGMFEAGYAAAWELGRLLALRSTDYATALFDWKRRRNQKRLRATLESPAGFPLAVLDIDDTPPATVLSWLTGLGTLAGVPNMYLIPDERLLPAESIRFLRLDPQWVHALLDGAFAVNRLSAADAELDLTFALPTPPEATGALIRSDIVSGYPGMLVDGYADADARIPLPPLTTRRLTPSILLCLFKGTLARLDIHQRPESLHFALELPKPGQIGKTLRDAAGAPGPTLPPLPLAPNGRIPVDSLAGAMAVTLDLPPFGAGGFARQMLETAERVTFLKG